MQRNTSQKVFIVFSIVMVFAMGLSVVLPLLRSVETNAQQSEAQTAAAPTAIPTSTPPVIPTDLSTISFNTTYLHPSGLFTVGEPLGWTPSSATNNGTEAKVSMSNATLQSVVEASVDTVAIANVNDLEGYFTPSYLGQSWANYSSWEETRRAIDGDNVLIDYNVKQGQRSYVARDRAWTDGQWIYWVRAVTPQDATSMLLYLIDNLSSTLQPIKEFAGEPTDWNAYFDTSDKHIIRFPKDWTLTDAAPGLPASIDAPDGTSLRVQAELGSVADADAAKAWVTATRSGVTPLTAVPVDRDGIQGFSVSYTYTNLDGVSFSGEVVLLNGANGRLHAANLRFPAANVDLNSDSVTSDYSNLVQVMGSFRILPNLDVTVPEAQPTPAS